MADQYLRKASLVAADGARGLDLSDLRIRFRTHQQDIQTPNRCSIRVYNPSRETAQSVQKEFSRAILQAGYQDGAYGVIFDGTLVQVRRGRESATDTYLDLFLADGDAALNFTSVAFAVEKGSTFRDRVDALSRAMGLPQGYLADLPTAELPRGRVFYGQARDHMRTVAGSAEVDWSVQNGQLQIIPANGYLPGEVVVLNSRTGMVGLPVQTNLGIQVRCLLNPRIKPGARVQIDEASVQQAEIDVSFTGAADNAFLPRIAMDGLYRVVVCEHDGDSRGQAWYSDLTCIPLGDEVTPGLLDRGYV